VFEFSIVFVGRCCVLPRSLATLMGEGKSGPPFRTISLFFMHVGILPSQFSYLLISFFLRPFLLCINYSQPVGLTASTHDPIDLTSNPCFQVGRSPSSDMQLIHPTSSRKHALIFHHPNGSCYVVDCGSSHGTFVNGVRVASPTLQQGSDQAYAVPHRVRKGSLIRFGGPGAPTFVLKSFTTSLEILVAELNAGKTRNGSSSCIVPSREGSHSPITSDRPAKGDQPSLSPTLSPTKPKPETECKLQSPCSPETALVAVNTRVNALGGGASLTDRNRIIAQEAAFKFATAPDERDQIDSCLLGKRSRFNSDGGFDTPFFDRVKRVRSASFPASFPLIFSPNPACSIIKNHDNDHIDATSHELRVEAWN